MRLLFLFLTFAAPQGIADPLYATTKPAVICYGVSSESTLYSATMAAGPAQPLPTSCVTVEPGFRFEAMNRAAWYNPPPVGHAPGVKMIYGREVRFNSGQESRYFCVLADYAAPLLGPDGSPIESPCAGLTNGVIPSIERDSAGRLYVHHYAVRSVCRDGRVKIKTRRLD